MAQTMVMMAHHPWDEASWDEASWWQSGTWDDHSWEDGGSWDTWDWVEAGQGWEEHGLNQPQVLVVNTAQPKPAVSTEKRTDDPFAEAPPGLLATWPACRMELAPRAMDDPFEKC